MSQQFPHEVLTLFREMQRVALQCVCRADADNMQEQSRKGPFGRSRDHLRGDVFMCTACEKWWDLHHELHSKLMLECSQWPAIQDPDWNFGPRAKRPAAIKRFRQLERAAALIV